MLAHLYTQPTHMKTARIFGLVCTVNWKRTEENLWIMKGRKSCLRSIAFSQSILSPSSVPIRMINWQIWRTTAESLSRADDSEHETKNPSEELLVNCGRTFPLFVSLEMVVVVLAKKGWFRLAVKFSKLFQSYAWSLDGLDLIFRTLIAGELLQLTSLYYPSISSSVSFAPVYEDFRVLLRNLICVSFHCLFLLSSRW